MKILVGILFCGENELEQCMASVRRQSHQDFELFTLKHLSKKEAHDTLYSTFMERAKDFDLFVKIDADMVLCRETFFAEVIAEMGAHPEHDHLKVLIDDWFSSSLIYGLNIYRSNVTWEKNQEMFFTDRVNREANPKSYTDADGPLVPAAWHCPNPSDFQSFHFGVHRAGKFNHAPSEKIARSIIKKMRLVVKIYRTKPEGMQRALALFGFFHVLRNGCDHSFMDYDSKGSATVFAAATAMNEFELRRRLDRDLAWYGFGLSFNNQLRCLRVSGGFIRVFFARLLMLIRYSCASLKFFLGPKSPQK